MAASIRNQIIVQLATNLQTISGLRFDRSRIRARNDNDGAVVGNIRPARQPYKEEVENPRGHYQVKRKTPIEVCLIGTGDIPDEVVDPYAVEVVKVMTADQKLGGLCNSIHEIERNWLFGAYDDPVDSCEVVLIFQVDYVTRRDDETQIY